MNQDTQSSSEIRGEPEPVMRRLADGLRQYQTSQDVLDDAVARFMGVNRTDLRCLDVVHYSGGVTPGQLASQSALTTGAVTVVLDRLERAGYVKRERDTGDRRKIWVSATPLSQALAHHLFGPLRQLGPALQRFTTQEVAAILSFLKLQGRVNQDMAALLGQHLQPDSSPETRLEQATKLEPQAEQQLQSIADGWLAGR